MRRLVYRDARPAAGVIGAAGRIKDWMRTALGLSSDVAMSVTELSCSAEGCPPRETVILVMPAGGAARKYAIHKAMKDVDEADIAASAARAPETL